jgi:hypothetical protein
MLAAAKAALSDADADVAVKQAAVDAATQGMVDAQAELATP